MSAKRTLYHYEHIGLLQPTRVSENGYRFYDNQAVIRLQKNSVIEIDRLHLRANKRAVTESESCG
ncbi:MerR family DNA-binding transcriptional regulator [Paenibacillus rhizoplanae]